MGSILSRHPDKTISGLGVHTVPDSYRIQKYPLWRAYSKSSGFASEFAGYVWTDAVSGKKNLRIHTHNIFPHLPTLLEILVSVSGEEPLLVK